MAELMQSLNDRVADLEAELATLRSFVEATDRDAHFAPPSPVRWVRTLGETIVGSGGTMRDYPEHDPDAPGCELPAVFLDGECGQTAADPFVWTPRAPDPQAMLVSPGGWIPELIELPVFLAPDGRWNVAAVPTLRVVTHETIPVGPSRGLVKMKRNGILQAQTFTAHYDWMHSTSMGIAAGTEGRAVLDVDERKWSFYAVSCE